MMTKLNAGLRVCTFLVGVFAALPALAQQEKGDKSFAGFGNLSAVKGYDGTEMTGTLGLTLGAFVGKNTEIGVQTTSTITSGTFVGSVGGYLRQYFGSDRTRPYVGLSSGILLLSAEGAGDVPTPITVIASFGVRQYMNRNSAFFIEATYGANSTQSDTGGFGFDDYPALNFGFAVVF